MQKKVISILTALGVFIGALGISPVQARAYVDVIDLAGDKVSTVTPTEISDAYYLNYVAPSYPSYTLDVSNIGATDDGEWSDKRIIIDKRDLIVPEDSFVYLFSSIDRQDMYGYFDTITILGTQKEENLYMWWTDFVAYRDLDEVPAPEDSSYGTGSVRVFLKKGTYKLWTAQEGRSNSSDDPDDIIGSYTISVLSIPVSKAVKVTQKLSKDKKSVTVSITNNLGAYLAGVHCSKGKRSEDSMRDSRRWGGTGADFDPNGIALRCDANKYKFTVKSNGYFTIGALLGDDSVSFSSPFDDDLNYSIRWYSPIKYAQQIIKVTSIKKAKRR